MRNKRTLLAVAAALAVCIIIAWSSTSLQGRETVYEVRPQISVPEYRSDAARAIDAYERMMERTMDLNENNLTAIGADLREVVRLLNSIDAKLGGLSARVARIEKSLGINKPKARTRKSQTRTPAPPVKE